MKIHVMRHGQTELNAQRLINGHLGDALTELGREQAKQAIDLLPKSIAHIYTSSLNRAVQTAEIVNKGLEQPMTLHDELMDINFGELNGKPFLPEYHQTLVTLSYDWRPSGENADQVKERVITILKKIKEENKGEDVLIVTHGGIVHIINFLETGEHLENIPNASIHSYDLDKVLANT